MNCTKCEGKSKVIDSRVKSMGVYRRRECLACGHRFSTIELEWDEVTDTAKRLDDFLNELYDISDLNDLEDLVGEFDDYIRDKRSLVHD